MHRNVTNHVQSEIMRPLKRMVNVCSETVKKKETGRARLQIRLSGQANAKVVTVLYENNKMVFFRLCTGAKQTGTNTVLLLFVCFTMVHRSHYKPNYLSNGSIT